MVSTAIFKALDAGKTVVFPTQTTARNYLESYVRTKGPGAVLFAENCIAFDKFYPLFLKEPENLEPCDPAVRRIFIREFLSSPAAQKLRHWNLSKLGDSIGAVTSQLEEILPETGTALEHSDEIYDSDLKADLRLLHTEYRAFLAADGLYDKAFLKPEKAAVDLKNYVLVLPELIRGYKKFSLDADLSSLKVITAKELSAGGKCEVLEVFENSYCELKRQIRRIRALLEKGTATDEIAISLADSSYEAFLRREAHLYSIPLRFVSGKKLSQYSAGRLFSGLLKAYGSAYSFSSVSALLSDNSFPWDCSGCFKEIVKAGIRAHVAGGKDEWKDAVFRSGNTAAKEKLASFFHLTDSICRSDSVERIRKSFSAFQDEMFGGKRFEEAEDESRNVYSYCVRTLDRLEDAMKSCSLETQENLFALFVAMLENTTYVPQSAGAAISVYPYPAAAAIRVKHHFVLGLSDRGTRIKEQGIHIIPKQSCSEAGYFAETDVSSDVLGVFGLSGENVYLSASPDTFTESVLLPTLFLGEGMSRKASEAEDAYLDEEDYYRIEQEFYRREKEALRKVLPMQKKSFGGLCLANGEDCPEPGIIRPAEAHPVLSATKIDTLENCPLRYALKYTYKIEDPELDEGDEDNAAYGNYVHDVWENFFKRIGTVNITEKNRTEYLGIILGEIEANFEKFGKVSGLPVPTLINCREKLISRSIRMLFGDLQGLNGYTFVDSERSERIECGGYSLEGRIDIILCNREGDYCVLDIKSGNAKKKSEILPGDGMYSIQLPVYQKLLTEGSLKKEPAEGMYLFLGGGALAESWNDENGAAKAKDRFAEVVGKSVADLSKQDEVPVFGKPGEQCAYCPYYRVCRLRIKPE